MAIHTVTPNRSRLGKESIVNTQGRLLTGVTVNGDTLEATTGTVWLGRALFQVRLCFALQLAGGLVGSRC